MWVESEQFEQFFFSICSDSEERDFWKWEKDEAHGNLSINIFIETSPLRRNRKMKLLQLKLYRMGIDWLVKCEAFSSLFLRDLGCNLSGPSICWHTRESVDWFLHPRPSIRLSISPARGRMYMGKLSFNFGLLRDIPEISTRDSCASFSIHIKIEEIFRLRKKFRLLCIISRWWVSRPTMANSHRLLHPTQVIRLRRIFNSEKWNFKRIIGRSRFVTDPFGGRFRIEKCSCGNCWR